MISTEPRVHSQIHEYQAKQRRSRLWHKIVSALACVVVFCTTYALILPAITMEAPRILDCPLVVHTHTADCYDEEGALVCGQADFVVHTHNQSCYDADGNLACLIPEREAHEHTDECYVVEKLLICELEEWKAPTEPEEPEVPGETVVHEHDESCYAAERGALICENEDEDHEHTDECYEWVPILTCALEESAGHEHTEDCYTGETAVLCKLEETAGHRHDESCYTAGQGELICGSEDEEHEHTDECYEQISVLSCGMEEGEGAHAHTEECYGQISTLTCGLEEGEGAHTHSTDCRLLICGLEEGERVPVDTDTAQAVPTGEKVLDVGDDAEAAPTSEKVLDVGGDAQAAPTSERVPGHIHTDECYEIKRTLTCEKEEIILHTHTDECYEDIYDEEGEWIGRTLICGRLEILEHVHTDECFVLAEEVFAGPYTYEDDSVAVEVTLAEGSAAPEGAELVVRPITGASVFSEDGGDGGYDYEALVQRAEEAVDKTVTGIVLYDISFYTPDGTYLPVEDTATVSLRFKEAVLAGDTGEVAVLHYPEDADLPVALESVDVERDEDDALSGVTFQTEGFSVFGVAVLADTKAGTDNIFTLTYNDHTNDHTITFNVVDSDGNAIEGDYNDITVSQDSTYLFSSGSAVVPDIDGYSFSGAKMENVSVAYVAVGYDANTKTQLDAFRFYDTNGGYYTRPYATTVILTYTRSGGITYDLKLPGMGSKGAGWRPTPTIDSTYQPINGDMTALFDKPKGSCEEPGPAGIAGLYRFDIQNTDDLQGEPFYADFDWYGEERFDGWTCTVDGTTYLLDPGAEVRSADGAVTVTASRKITTTGNLDTIEDIGPVPLTLPGGTTLTGHWTEVSSVVTMYVNYTGTILDVEGDVKGRNGHDFTRSVAVGHVFYGKQTVGDNDTFGTNANAAISAMFQPKFDADNPDTQVVIEYLRRCTETSTDGKNYTTKVDVAYHGANSNVLEEKTLKLIKETGRTIQLSTSEKNNPPIDNALCDTDHYQIRWYVLKEQTDAWHIDGVLVARTEELAVTKTFTGLSDQQVIDLLGGEEGNGFNISVALGEKGSSQSYITMLPKNQPNGKQYVYMGQDTNIHSYHWTLYTINGEKYTLTEQSYQLDGYDVSSIVVEYYLDENGDTQIRYAYGDNTDSSSEIPQVEGGRTTAVSFNNLYTLENTGAFAITKREEGADSSSVGGMLPGAKFTLTPTTGGTPQTATSNINGTAYFNNLSEGTYTLEETKAPDGYKRSDHTWTVEVTTDGHVVVTVYENDADGVKLIDNSGTVCYDSKKGGVQESYEIYNTPNRNTVTVRKTFTGITTEELNAVIQQSVTDLAGTPSGYYIQLQGTVESGNVHEGETIDVTLTLDHAQRTPDGRTFIWTIHNMHVDNTTYTITEHNYLHDNYIDAVVSARLNGTSVTATENADSGTCQISEVRFNEKTSDTVTITNHYTNTFDLKLMKVDSGEAHTPLAGAVFDIYGNYTDSTNVNKTVTYEENGVTKTAYYIGATSHSGADGIATYSGLRLSKEGSTFVYVIQEFQSPNGYVKLDEPIIHTVTIDSQGYDGGVFTFTAENTRDKDYVHRTLDTKKVWSPSTPPTGATVTLELYQVVHTQRNRPLDSVVEATRVASVTLNGEADGEQTIADGVITAYESAPWVATWTNLPSAADTYDTDGAHYHYFVREAVTVNGYATSYTCYDLYDEVPDGAIQTLQVGDETFQGVLIADMDDAYTATVVNTTSFELPETGGVGTLPYAMGGALLMAASLLCGYKLRRKLERRYRC